MSSGSKRRNGCCLPILCLVQLCLTCSLVYSDVQQLSFVPGVSWDRHRPAKRQVARRSHQKGQGSQETPDGDAKSLTSRIKNSRSAQDLIDALDGSLKSDVFNFFHVSAAYHKLATLHQRRCLQTSEWDSPTIEELHTVVLNMVLQDRLNAQASSNVLWSVARLSEKFSVPMQLLVALGQSIPTKVTDMDAQELANSLWSTGRLKGVAPVVLDVVPSIVAQIPGKAKNMIPQHLSNCLWASLQLQEDAPAVLEIVPVIAAEVLPKMKDMTPQALSNILESLLVLQDSVPEVAEFADEIVTCAASRLNIQLPNLAAKSLKLDVPTTVWACARIGFHSNELLASVADRLGSRNKVSSLKDFGLCALTWSYQVLCDQNEFTEFQKLLKLEINRRGFSQADVERSKLGYIKYYAGTQGKARSAEP